MHLKMLQIFFFFKQVHEDKQVKSVTDLQTAEHSGQVSVCPHSSGCPAEFCLQSAAAFPT